MASTPKTLADYKAPYPEPTEDQKRFVIFLDEKPGEAENYKLQLIPGRTEKLDSVNQYFIGGTVKEETIDGWGYSYYVVEMGQMAGTLIGIQPSDVPTDRFVPMVERPFISYNSKLPVVVYMPKNAELRYRVWTPTRPVPESAKEV